MLSDVMKSSCKAMISLATATLLVIGSATPAFGATSSSIGKAKISSMTSTKVASVTVKWKKVKSAKKYQVKVGTNKKVTKGVKTYTVKSTVKYKTVKGLKQGKRYYAKVRAYKVKNGKKVYGKWSAVKSAITKKETKRVNKPVEDATINMDTNVETKDPTGGDSDPTEEVKPDEPTIEDPTEPVKPSNPTISTSHEDGTQDDPCCHSHHYVLQNLSNTTAPKQKTVKEKKVMTEGKWHEEWFKDYIQCNIPLPGCTNSDPVDPEHRCCWKGEVTSIIYDSQGHGDSITQYQVLVKHLKEKHYDFYKDELLKTVDAYMSNSGRGEEFDNMSFDEKEKVFYDNGLMRGFAGAHEVWSETRKVWDEEPQVISYFPEKTILVDSRARKATKVCTKCGKTEEVKTLVAYDGSHVHDIVKFKDMELNDAEQYYLDEIKKSTNVSGVCRECGVWVY